MIVIDLAGILFVLFLGYVVLVGVTGVISCVIEIAEEAWGFLLKVLGRKGET